MVLSSSISVQTPDERKTTSFMTVFKVIPKIKVEILGHGVLLLPRPSLTPHSSIATITRAQWSHPHGDCWWHADTWTRVAWCRAFSTTLAVLSLVLAQKSKWQFCPWVVAHLQPPPRLRVCWSVSWCLLYFLHTVLRDAAEAALLKQLLWASETTLRYH